MRDRKKKRKVEKQFAGGRCLNRQRRVILRSRQFMSGVFSCERSKKCETNQNAVFLNGCHGHSAYANLSDDQSSPNHHFHPNHIGSHQRSLNHIGNWTSSRAEGKGANGLMIGITVNAVSPVLVVVAGVALFCFFRGKDRKFELLSLN
jgi:hypothetical protein